MFAYMCVCMWSYERAVASACACAARVCARACL